MKIVFASNNKNKYRELNALIKQLSIELILQSDSGIDEIEETGLTFVENALNKARHASRMAGLPAIADDSGLAVAALNGAPGIYSARYAGDYATSESNINKLLIELKDIPDKHREAYFYCVLVCLLDERDPMPLICEGKWQGRILHQAKGNKGFGYDPIFYIPSKRKTAAELSLAIKNKISHRGIALQMLMHRLVEKL
ncbi:MAG TPA: RdgB/HAM1 family non-canonical purine NTP pyrophosphatase [Gammaproteobacteria bacterium]|nr:RdgB/HAM1 family non-canonical purine NTP pyrophosphatase [Gammaproteobacteria bacterium]